MQLLPPESLKYPSPFYRVTAKAIVLDDQNRLLIVKNKDGNWELPGGGWEHDESFEACLQRETEEEVGVPATSVGEIIFSYRGVNVRRGFITLRLAARVTLSSYDVRPGDVDITEVKFVNRTEFSELDFTTNEGDVADHLDSIWPRTSLLTS